MPKLQLGRRECLYLVCLKYNIRFNYFIKLTVKLIGFDFFTHVLNVEISYTFKIKNKQMGYDNCYLNKILFFNVQYLFFC